jgi:hypothetical protein
MTKPKGILCIDIDGTLIDANERVHPRDITRLKAFPKDLQPIFTTGRILHSAKGVLQENGLFPEKRMPWPGVFMNGGVAYLPEEVLCLSHAFSQELRQDLIALAKSFPDSDFTFFTVDSVFLVNPTPFGRDISVRHHLQAREILPQDLPEDIVKVMILDENPQRLLGVEVQSRTIRAETAYSLNYALEINPLNINKANTLRTLIAAMGLQDIPVYSIGDAENDLSMFEIAAATFAPDDADPRITSRVTRVIQRQETGLLGPVFDFLHILGTI